MVDLDTVKKSLEAKLVELSARAVGIEKDLREKPDADWSEHAVEAEDDEVLEEMGDLARDEIRAIEAALARIEDGSYGICRTCDEPIPEKRLEALPYATTCINCSTA